MIKGTQTEKNLLKAFAGESQARNRYTMFSKVAKKEGYEQIANIFLETAGNEYEHASLFFKKLEGGPVEITATYPAGKIGTTLENLKECITGEHEEFAVLYPEFASVARKEGFEDVARLFDGIGKIEKEHEDRYQKLYDNLSTDTVYKKEEEVEWQCLECGNIVKGKEAPLVCPVCSHPRAYFQLKSTNY
jgi:rubrerythrin